MLKKPDRMVKCRIVAPKKHLPKIISSLYNLGLYHLIPHSKRKGDLDIGEPLAEAEELSALLVKVRSILSKFPTFPENFQIETITPKKLEQDTKKSISGNLISLVLISYISISTGSLSITFPCLDNS